jgi:nucleoside transporter
MSSEAPTAAPPLDMGLRIRLSIMMFLQFAIWGAWFVVFYPYVTGKGFSDAQAGALMGNMALGAIISTMFAGYIADRYFASEKMMAVLHLAGAGLLYWMAQIQKPEEYGLLFGVSLGYALLYNPTLALSNSIAFTHIPNATRDFPGLRVLGTIGWIVAGFLIDFLFKRHGVDSQGNPIVIPASASNGPLLLAAGLSAVLGVFSLLLPHTPPTGKADDPMPVARAIGLFRDPSFTVFFTVSFAITIVLAFYYTCTSAFLESAAGVKDTGSTMAIGQICEMVFLPLLPFFLFRMGMKWVLALGMFCWGLRYFLFAYGGPMPAEGSGGSLLPFSLVILGVALHGFCFDFFFAAGFIHVDNEAPKDIRASGQALFGFLTYGVGMWIGSLLAGWLKGRFTVDGAIDWQTFWLVPAAGVMLALLVFVIFFRMHTSPRAEARDQVDF